MKSADAGTRFIVSLGRDEVAQLAVAGSLSLAAARFIAMPEPVFITGSIDLPSAEEAYAAMRWDASLRTDRHDGTTVIEAGTAPSLLPDQSK